MVIQLGDNWKAPGIAPGALVPERVGASDIGIQSIAAKDRLAKSSTHTTGAFEQGQATTAAE